LSATADVAVHCYDLSVAKTANTSLTRTYTWTIDKTADPTSVALLVGDTATVNYSLVVGATAADSAWAVNGTITVTNPAPMSAMLTSVSDAFGDVNGTVACGTDVTFPYSLSADSSLVCNYTLALTGPTGGTNVATATLQNTSANETFDGPGTTGFTGSAAVDFSNAAITSVDAQAVVSDSFAGPYVDANASLPATLSADQSPVTLTYSRDVGPYAAAGDYGITNTATVTATDTSTQASSIAIVGVTVGTSGGGGGGGGGSDSGGDNSNSGGLPHTGASPSTPALLLLGIVLTGTGLVAVRRRRQDS